MAIVISRVTGEVMQGCEPTEAMRSQMLDRIVAAFLEANPEAIRAKVAEYQRQQAESA